MAIDIIKDVNRLAGFAVEAGKDIISGQPVVLANSNTVTPYAGTGQVLGLALDDTLPFVLADVQTTKAQSGTARPIYDKPSGDLTPQSLFFSEINRGGKVSVAVDGGVFGLLNDGRGSPFVADDDGFAINGLIYANDDGLITSDSDTDANPQVGVCLKTPADDGKLVVLLRL
jgi:hypothetical protein